MNRRIALIALVTFGAVLSIKIVLMMSLLGLGNYMYSKDKPEEARGYYNILQFANFFEPEVVLANIGNTYYVQSKYQDSIKYYQDALAQSQPKYICPISLNLGNSIVRIQEGKISNKSSQLNKDEIIKELEIAISYYDKCLEKEPNNESAVTNISLVKLLIEKIKEAENTSSSDQQTDNTDAETKAKEQQQQDEKNQQDSKKQKDYYKNRDREPSYGNNW